MLKGPAVRQASPAPSAAPSLAPSVKVEAAIKASGLPKAARRPAHLDLGRSSAVAGPAPVAEGGVFKMGRRDTWARFLAYEARRPGHARI